MVLDDCVIKLEAAEEAIEVNREAVGVVDRDSVCMATLHITSQDFTDEAYEALQAVAPCASFTRVLALP